LGVVTLDIKIKQKKCYAIYSSKKYENDNLTGVFLLLVIPDIRATLLITPFKKSFKTI